MVSYICMKKIFSNWSKKEEKWTFFAYMNNRRYDSCLKKSTSSERFLIFASEHYLKIIISWSILSMVSFFMEMQSSDDYGCHDIGCLLRTKEMESSKNLWGHDEAPTFRFKKLYKYCILSTHWNEISKSREISHSRT